MEEARRGASAPGCRTAVRAGEPQDLCVVLGDARSWPVFPDVEGAEEEHAGSGYGAHEREFPALALPLVGARGPAPQASPPEGPPILGRKLSEGLFRPLGRFRLAAESPVRDGLPTLAGEMPRLLPARLAAGSQATGFPVQLRVEHVRGGGLWYKGHVLGKVEGALPEGGAAQGHPGALLAEDEAALPGGGIRRMAHQRGAPAGAGGKDQGLLEADGAAGAVCCLPCVA